MECFSSGDSQAKILHQYGFFVLNITGGVYVDTCVDVFLALSFILNVCSYKPQMAARSIKCEISFKGQHLGPKVRSNADKSWSIKVERLEMESSAIKAVYLVHVKVLQPT